MRLAVISDTHYIAGFTRLPEDFWERLQGVDGIIHSGDIGDQLLYIDLQQLAPIIAVLGNNDGFAFGNALPERQIVPVEEVKIGLFHGHRGSAPFGFTKDEVDMVICGHTHVPRDEVIDGIRIINPGSVTRPRGGSLASMGILEIQGKEIHWQLCPLTK